MSKKRIGLYPGTFDPFTNGHLDIVCRALSLFDKLILACGINREKKCLLNVEERIRLMEHSTQHLEGVEVISFEGLTAEVAKKHGAAIVRGIRQEQDFCFEMQMTAMNRSIQPEVQTVWIPASSEYAHLSSSLVKEVAKWGGPVSKMVPGPVAEAILAGFS